MIDLILAKHKVLDFVLGKVVKPTDDAGKEKYRETNILDMNLIVDGVKDNLIPYISNIDTAQDMYEALSKLFTIKNIGQIAILKNELRIMKMTKDDIVYSYLMRISRIRYELQAIDEVIPEKELVILKSWSSFASSISSWKDTPSFEQMWNACSQEDARISLANYKKEEDEDNSSYAYSANHKKGGYTKFKGPKKKVDLSKVERYNCHKMGHYNSQCPENPRNKRREREHANVVDEAPPKKNKAEESEVKDIDY